MNLPTAVRHHDGLHRCGGHWVCALCCNIDTISNLRFHFFSTKLCLGQVCCFLNQIKQKQELVGRASGW